MSLILIIPDKFFGPDSGAHAARAAARLWQEIGCEVAVYAEPARPEWVEQGNGVQCYVRPTFRTHNHLRGGSNLEHFEQFLEELRPTHVFFLGSAISKTAGFFAACRRRQIRTMALWWTQDFYCANTYACLEDGPCVRCMKGYMPSFVHRCGYQRYAKWKYARLALGAASRSALIPQIRQLDVVMGSSQSQLDLYRQLGIPQDRMVRCPLFFPNNRLAGLESKRGDYFIYYGQTRPEKGFHLFKPIVQSCRSGRFVIPFTLSEVAEQAVAEFGLQELIRSGRVEIASGVNWDGGVGKLVAESRGVLLPSIWPTTTEYTLLESIGLGKPLVAFDVGIHKEVIVSGENGLVAKVGDVEGFARHLDALASSDTLCDKLSVGARGLFQRLTSEERIRDAFRSALKTAERSKSASATVQS